MNARSNTAPNKSFRDKLSTVDERGKRNWLFPQKPKGRLYNARSAVSFVYLLIFFVLPFIKVNGHPLFLVNVLDRKFILFGQIFWPQDFFIFGLGMVIFIVFISLFTVVFGRVFCGWVCPQTIFMEMVFRKVEYFIEGDAAEQRTLAKSPWDTNKILRKTTKWVSFWVISFLIANTFLAYVIGIDNLRKIVSEPIGNHLGGFIALVVFTSIFFFVYSWMREQICLVVCPYGRMQGVLLDKDSIVVAYDYARGEPRGKFDKRDKRNIGDCIDCMQCVKVCPTGIDIRNGTQLECINCTACIDACDKMMNAVGLPTGLVRLASENNIAHHKKIRFTGRMKAYTAVMLVLLGALVWMLATRTDVDVTVLRTPGQLYQTQPGHQFSNLYNYKLLNKTFANKTLTFKPENFKGEIKIVGDEKLKVTKDSYASGSLFIYIDSATISKRKTQLQIGVYEGERKIKTVNTSFLGPITN